MALKVDRYEHFVSTDFFMSETGEAGSFVVFSPATTGVGSSLDDINSQVTLPKSSGVGELVAGMLVGDVVDINVVKFHTNPFRRETQVGGKVGIDRDGVQTTNKIDAAAVPAAGKPAYVADGGKATTVSGTPRVGTFLSGKDADGYAKIDIEIDNV